ncbi:UNVERIFIED_CONTAM: hypothetical protein Slati_0417200 [Sesamum latifolium]|uniref:Uncharacterized protein n=1 Tax=Sesamum latifolium TaxID=2727402 RepID=A0AAW2XVB3_9LAMI
MPRVGATGPMAYEVLQSYDFPMKFSQKGFSLDGSYELEYKSRISGYIDKDKLTKLSGVRVKVLLFWLDIVEVRRNGEKLEFSVGMASAEFPVNSFLCLPKMWVRIELLTAASLKMLRVYQCLMSEFLDAILEEFHAPQIDLSSSILLSLQKLSSLLFFNGFAKGQLHVSGV